MKQVKIFIFALGITLAMMGCDIGSLISQVLPGNPTPTATATTRALAQPTRAGTPASNATTAPAATSANTSAPPIPPGWQLVKYSKDESCTVAVPPDWKVDARISSALKTDAQNVNGTVSVALANSNDWNGFKTRQIDTAAVPAKVVENSATRLWFEVNGDGKALQAGAVGTTVAVLAPNGKICMSILGTDGKAAPSWRDVLTSIAKTVAFR